MTWKKDTDVRPTENFKDWREIGAKKNEKTRQTARRKKRERGKEKNCSPYASSVRCSFKYRIIQEK